MKFRSTRNDPEHVSLSEAIVRGLAPDGGLYVPVELPKLSPHAGSLTDVATQIFEAFGDEEDFDWRAIAESAFDFPTPIVSVGEQKVLELFHGPTAAFKDYGARFLARVLSAISETRGEDRTILVATSGDTGGAVASAFFRVPRIKVVVLYPDGRISELQETQLTCWGENVSAAAVRGTFDDCQRLVKEAFNSPGLRGAFGLSSANSINIGRLIPQMAYYGWASLELSNGQPVSFCIPTGNLGNALACVWAKHVGFPIGEIQLATNANHTLPDFFESGDYEGRPAIATHANAMDVGDPSNFERLVDLFPTVAEMEAFGLSATSVSDERIASQIQETFDGFGYLSCPHTACALHVANRGAVVVGTAHPAKFEDVIEPLVGSVPIPSSLEALLDLETERQVIDATLEAVESLLVD